MKAIISGKESIIKFKYEDAPVGNGTKTSTAKQFHRRGTIAYLKHAGSSDVVAQVTALNSGKVPFTFAQGRKAAFAKLLKTLNLERSERAQIWSEFFTQCPNTVDHVSMKSEKIKKTAEA